ncbi:hypothetical protein HAX54_051091 [Datura stramonium]|uniref:Uncharacterized protein n=1 Tax=Datura stramonium TaxID=4076 RepID=A0ABS8WQY4_DATST|nr:hypothetical protein [Datura stramonium]
MRCGFMCNKRGGSKTSNYAMRDEAGRLKSLWVYAGSPPLASSKMSATTSIIVIDHDSQQKLILKSEKGKQDSRTCALGIAQDKQHKAWHEAQAQLLQNLARRTGSKAEARGAMHISFGHPGTRRAHILAHPWAPRAAYLAHSGARRGAVLQDFF